jgi:hypothetical protein
MTRRHTTTRRCGSKLEALFDEKADESVGVEHEVLIAGVAVPDDGVQTWPKRIINKQTKQNKSLDGWMEGSKVQ